jgi:hypothetical protein
MRDLPLSLNARNPPMSMAVQMQTQEKFNKTRKEEMEKKRGIFCFPTIRIQIQGPLSANFFANLEPHDVIYIIQLLGELGNCGRRQKDRKRGGGGGDEKYGRQGFHEKYFLLNNFVR